MRTTIESYENWPDDPAVLRFWAEQASTPMQTLHWYRCWWDCYAGEQDRLLILVVKRDGKPLALLPAYLRRHWSGSHTLRLLGDRVICSDFQSILMDPSEIEVATDALLEWLRHEAWRNFASTAVWDGISETAGPINRIVAGLERTWHAIARTSSVSTWRVSCKDGWSGVLGRMSKTQRKQSRNLLNRLDRVNGLTVRFLTDADSVERAALDCVRLHRREWQCKQSRDSCGNAAFPRFLRSACGGLAAEGQAEAVELSIDGQVAGVLITLLDQHKNRYFYQIGWEPSVANKSPGRMLFLAAMRNACQQQSEFVDFLRGDELYKRRFGASPTGCQRIVIVPPRIIPQCIHQATIVARSIKRDFYHIADALGHTSNPS